MASVSAVSSVVASCNSATCFNLKFYVLVGNRETPVAPGPVFALVVLFAINLMNFFDRQIIGGVGEGIRREWGLSDSALGLLGTVFTLLYAVVGLPLGRLSDKIQRRKILSAGVFLWSLLTAVSGLARS